MKFNRTNYNDRYWADQICAGFTVVDGEITLTYLWRNSRGNKIKPLDELSLNMVKESYFTKVYAKIRKSSDMMKLNGKQWYEI